MEDSRLHERIAVIETKVGNLENAVSKQLNTNETVTRLATLMEVQIEENAKREARQELRDIQQNQQMERFSKTLMSVEKSMTSMNEEIKNMGWRVEEIEKKQDKITEAQTIDLSATWKSILKWLFGLIGVIATAYILIRLGLK